MIRAWLRNLRHSDRIHGSHAGTAIGVIGVLIFTKVSMELGLSFIQSLIVSIAGVGLWAHVIEQYVGDARTVAPLAHHVHTPSELTAIQTARTDFVPEKLPESAYHIITSRYSSIDHAGGEEVFWQTKLSKIYMINLTWRSIRNGLERAKNTFSQPFWLLVALAVVTMLWMMTWLDFTESILDFLTPLVILGTLVAIGQFIFLTYSGTRVIVTSRQVMEVFHPPLWWSRPTRRRAILHQDIDEVFVQLPRLDNAEHGGYLSFRGYGQLYRTGLIPEAAKVYNTIEHVRVGCLR